MGRVPGQGLRPLRARVLGNLSGRFHRNGSSSAWWREPWARSGVTRASWGSLGTAYFSGPGSPPPHSVATTCVWAAQRRSRTGRAQRSPCRMASVLPPPICVPTGSGRGPFSPASTRSPQALRGGAAASPRRACQLSRERDVHRHLRLLPQDCVPPRAGRGGHEEAVPRTVLHLPYLPPPAGRAELLSEGWAASL